MALLEMEHVSGNAPIVFRTVSGSITRANASRSSITAPAVTGYDFLCWLQVTSSGWIGNIYIESPLNSTSNIWSANYGMSDTATGNVSAVAMYIEKQ